MGNAKAMDGVAPVGSRLCVGDSASSARPEDRLGQASWADSLDVHESKAGSSRKGVLKTCERVALERTGMLAHFRDPVGSGVIFIGEGRGALKLGRKYQSTADL